MTKALLTFPEFTRYFLSSLSNLVEATFAVILN